MHHTQRSAPIDVNYVVEEPHYITLWLMQRYVFLILATLENSHSMCPLADFGKIFTIYRPRYGDGEGNVFSLIRMR